MLTRRSLLSGGLAAGVGLGLGAGWSRDPWAVHGDVSAAYVLAVISDPFPAPAARVQSTAMLDQMVPTWKRLKLQMEQFYGGAVLYRIADQAGIVGLNGVLDQQGVNPLATSPFTPMQRWLDTVGPRNHVGLAVTRHQGGARWDPIGLDEVERRTAAVLGTPGVRGRIASLSGNEEPDNPERRGEARRDPKLVADQVAAMMRGADTAGFGGTWVVTAVNAWDATGQRYATDLRRAFDAAGVSGRFSQVGFHCYPQRNPRAREALAGGLNFLTDLWGLPVLADQIAVTPDNAPGRMAVWSWFALAHHRSIGGWWPFRSGFNVGPLGRNYLVDVRAGQPTPHGAVLQAFLQEVAPYPLASVVPGDRPGRITVGGRALEFVDDELRPWRWAG